LAQYGLPASGVQADIFSLVQMASVIVDIECGRVDGDGNGSLAYTTYVQRDLLQTRNRNLVLLNAKPIVGLTQQVSDDLTALASTGTFNCYQTGFQVNTLNSFGGSMLSGIIGASGRYGYSRQDMSIAYPDLFAFINPLNLVTMFGGPAPWVPIDVTNTDYDPKTGEVWIPAGLQLQKYSEILITYNSGYDPRRIPFSIKFVTSSIVKNALAQGDATTALLSMSVSKGGVAYRMGPKLIDPTLDAMLQPYRTVRAY
jgi:hypothetical protein